MSPQPDNLSPSDKKKIAEDLKISPRTVDRALEDDQDSQRLRDINRAREKRGLGVPPAAIIGLLVPEFLNPFFVSLSNSIESLLVQQDYQLVPSSSNSYGWREKLNVQWLLNMRASGVFYCQNPPFKESLDQLRRASDVSVVLVDIEGDHGFADRVLADNSAGIKRAVAHLALENDHKLIGFLAGPDGSSTADARLKAFMAAIKAYGLDGEGPPLILHGDYSAESGKNAAIELADLWHQKRKMPTAIVSANDRMAIGLLKGLEKIAGLNVPEQLSVVGFDNIGECETVTPELTSIDQRVALIAERAVNLMLGRIKSAGSSESVDSGVSTKPVLPELMSRQSVMRYSKGAAVPDASLSDPSKIT